MNVRDGSEKEILVSGSSWYRGDLTHLGTGHRGNSRLMKDRDDGIAYDCLDWQLEGDIGKEDAE